jgi:hypothetical protein
MNWITKIIKAGEKIKLLFMSELQRKILQKVIGQVVVEAPFLKKI